MMKTKKTLLSLVVLALSVGAFGQNYSYYEKAEKAQLKQNLFIDGIAVAQSAQFIAFLNRVEINMITKNFPELGKQYKSANGLLTESKKSLKDIKNSMDKISKQLDYSQYGKATDIAKLRKQYQALEAAKGIAEARVIFHTEKVKIVSNNIVNSKNAVLAGKDVKGFVGSASNLSKKLNYIKNGRRFFKGFGVAVAVDFLLKAGILLRSTDDVGATAGQGVYKTIDYTAGE